MTDRHIHCVYCKKSWLGEVSISKDGTINDDDAEEICECSRTGEIFYPLRGDSSKKGWFEPHCDYFIPNPRLLLTYFIYYLDRDDIVEIAATEAKTTLTVAERMEECTKLADKFLDKYFKWLNKDDYPV